MYIAIAVLIELQPIAYHGESFFLTNYKIRNIEETSSNVLLLNWIIIYDLRLKFSLNLRFLME